MNKYLLLIFLFFIYACGEGQVGEIDTGRYNFEGGKIYIDVEDSGNGVLKVIFSVGEFEDVDNMSIDLFFDYSELEITGFTNGDFTHNETIANSYKMGLPDSLTSFLFQDVSGSGTLFSLNINADDQEDQPILIDLETLDMTTNGESIYYYCTDSDYQNRAACLNSGNFWRLNYEELQVESICYVDAHPDNGIQYGGYIWIQGEFCRLLKTW